MNSEGMFQNSLRAGDDNLRIYVVWPNLVLRSTNQVSVSLLCKQILLHRYQYMSYSSLISLALSQRPISQLFKGGYLPAFLCLSQLFKYCTHTTLLLIFIWVLHDSASFLEPGKEGEAYSQD